MKANPAFAVAIAVVSLVACTPSQDAPKPAGPGDVFVVIHRS